MNHQDTKITKRSAFDGLEEGLRHDDQAHALQLKRRALGVLRAFVVYSATAAK